MPVTGGRRPIDVSQRAQYLKGGIGRRYWDYRDARALEHVVGPRILDAGCGEGLTTEKLLRAFPAARVLAVDVDPRNVLICRERRLPVLHADLESLPFDDASFDTCLCMEVIEHLKDPRRAMAEIARVTRPGGRVIVVYPVDWLFWLARVACLRFAEATFDPGHLRQWNTRDLAILMTRCGLKPALARELPLPSPFMLHGLMVGIHEKGDGILFLDPSPAAPDEVARPCPPSAS